MKLSFEESRNCWCIADTHFDHANIIKYCDRKFQDIEEMNNIILTNWNANIKRDDLVFFLGDLVFGRCSRSPKDWLKLLNGRIIYLKGNHDRDMELTSQRLDNILFVTDFLRVNIESLPLLMIHDPQKVNNWDNWKVHGHTHNREGDLFINWETMKINVSVEIIDYKPINLYSLVQMIL